MANDWSDYLKDVLPETAGCPITVAVNAIRMAAIELCDDSRIWREQINDLSISLAGGQEYVLDASNAESAAQLVAVHRVRLTDSRLPLPTLPLQHLDNQALREEADRPAYYNQVDPGTIKFYPPPDNDYTAEIWAILKPTQGSTQGPSFLYNQWLDVIACGAKARLQNMSKRSWFDPVRARDNRTAFVRGKTEARIRDAKSHVLGSSVMMPRQKFGRYHNSRWFR